MMKKRTRSCCRMSYCLADLLCTAPPFALIASRTFDCVTACLLGKSPLHQKKQSVTWLVITNVIYRSTTITSPGANHEQALAHFILFFLHKCKQHFGKKVVPLPWHTWRFFFCTFPLRKKSKKTAIRNFSKAIVGKRKLCTKQSKTVEASSKFGPASDASFIHQFCL